MGQQPNIELDMSDLPRPVAHPAPARRWLPSRPGDLGGPADLPVGESFGSTGPDGGYGLRLAAELDITLAVGESARTARAAIAAVASARAARAGRAPTMEDAIVGALIMGYSGANPDSLEELAARRRSSVANIDHSTEKVRSLLARVREGALMATPDELRARLEEGERFFD